MWVKASNRRALGPGGLELGWSAVAWAYALCVALAGYLVLHRRSKDRKAAD
jgi:hypothetical protein